VRTSRALIFSAVLLTVAALMCSAQAQDAKPAAPTASAGQPETVIVTGQRPTRAQREKIVWDFVYAHAKLTPKIDQLARWVKPVCPEVQNLPPAYAKFIMDRIRTVAKGAGAPVAEPCKTDILIVFTSDPQGFMNDVADKRPALLGWHYVHQTGEIATVTKPVQAWYVTDTSNRIETYRDDHYHPAVPGETGSRISRGHHSVLDTILIVADSRKVSGIPVGQIADYLAMLSLSEADAPDDCHALSSMLDLLSADCSNPDRPQSLTAGDRAYLEGLYAMDMEEIGSLQRSSVANSMLRNQGSK
jgi:hypothetical protein